MPLYNQSGYGSGKYGLADNGPIYNLPISYYLNLFTSEYRLSTNLIAFETALLTPLDDVSQCLTTFTPSFNLDTAVGAQLDIDGQIIGASRTVGFQPSGGVSPVLDDDTYRLLLLAKQAQNQWDGKMTSLQPIWQNLFPGGNIVIVDNENMTATIILTGVFTSIIQDLITNGYIVPRPEGVQYTYAFGELPIFGFDEDDDFIAGFDLGHFI